jgi:hypothetical protein
MGRWADKHFGAAANIVRRTGTIDGVIETMRSTTSTPSTYFAGHTHLILLYDTELIVLFDHYHCDGIILFDIVSYVTETPGLQAKMPVYRYIPVVSDMLLIPFLAKMAEIAFYYPSQIRAFGEVTDRRFDRQFDRRAIAGHATPPIWNRWTNYAVALLPLFECVDVAYLRVGITVGFNDDRTFCNTRTGVIVVVLDRPAKGVDPVETIRRTAQTIHRQCDAQAIYGQSCYDLVRSFNIPRATTRYGGMVLDVIFTAARFNPVDAVDSISIDFPKRIDGDASYMFMSNMTVGETTYNSITTNWTDFDDRCYTRICRKTIREKNPNKV